MKLEHLYVAILELKRFRPTLNFEIDFNRFQTIVMVSWRTNVCYLRRSYINLIYIDNINLLLKANVYHNQQISPNIMKSVF